MLDLRRRMGMDPWNRREKSAGKQDIQVFVGKQDAQVFFGNKIFRFFLENKIFRFFGKQDIQVFFHQTSLYMSSVVFKLQLNPNSQA